MGATSVANAFRARARSHDRAGLVPCRTGKYGGQRLRQHRAGHRLAQEAVESGVGRGRLGVGIGAGGDGDQGSGEPFLPHQLGQRQAVYPGQVEVEQGRVERLGVDRRQCGQPVRRAQHAMALAFEQAGEHLRHRGIVLHQQQLQAARLRRSGCGIGAGRRPAFYTAMRNAGLNLLAFDYRGYGASARRSPTVKGAILDAEAAFSYATESLGVDLSQMTRTADGLYYQDLAVGGGDVAARDETAVLRYTGWLTNGRRFDSGQITAALDGESLIEGFTEGVLGMRVGGTRRLVIPPQLGYGSSVQGVIPAGAVLVFEVELLDIVSGAR